MRGSWLLSWLVSQSSQKPCTALCRLAVLICTVFGGTPCTELCEYRDMLGADGIRAGQALRECVRCGAVYSAITPSISICTSRGRARTAIAARAGKGAVK